MMTTFKDLGLLPGILKSLEIKGYEKPTPIQELVIPHLLKGKDMLGIAQTGTGKTAAFSLPVIQRLGSNSVRLRSTQTRCLILTPTRELASQINHNIEEYSKSFNLSSVVVFGGVSQSPQVRKLAKGVDFTIATPGRLLDLMQNGKISFEQLEVLILDEADRMLDMGFIRDIEKIVKRIPKKRQTLLFSATMPKDIEALSSKLLYKPQKVEVTPESTTVDLINQKINYVAKANKNKLLVSVLKKQDAQHVLVFTRTKRGANKVTEYLVKENISAAAIHGNKSQGARERALKGFTDGKLKVLVATDIAARGIDVPLISHVINFDLPVDPKSYVHRIGRTARAGREGTAISFCDPSEKSVLKSIEKCIKMLIPVDTSHDFHGVSGKKKDRKEFNKKPDPFKPKKYFGRKKKPSSLRRSL